MYIQNKIKINQAIINIDKTRYNFINIDCERQHHAVTKQVKITKNRTKIAQIAIAFKYNSCYNKDSSEVIRLVCHWAHGPRGGNGRRDSLPNYYPSRHTSSSLVEGTRVGIPKNSPRGLFFIYPSRYTNFFDHLMMISILYIIYAYFATFL